jgi:hypothetical protein
MQEARAAKIAARYSFLAASLAKIRRPIVSFADAWQQYALLRASIARDASSLVRLLVLFIRR